MIEKINLKKGNAVDRLFSYLRLGTLNNHMRNEFDDGLTHLTQRERIIIPNGARHRPVCGSLVKCLLIELDETLDASNTGGAYIEEQLAPCQTFFMGSILSVSGFPADRQSCI